MTSFAPSLPSPAAPAAPRYRNVGWKANPVLGPLRDLNRDLFSTFGRMAKEGDAVSFRVLHQRLHLLTHPDHFRHVLVDEAQKYRKQTRGYVLMRKLLRDGLLTSEGDFWLRQRRLAQPAFHRHRIAAFGDTMVRVAAETAAKWTDGVRLDVSHEMMEATFRIVTLTLMSRDAKGEAEKVGAALGDALAHITHRMQTPWSLPEWIPTPANRRFESACRTLSSVVDEVIAERRAEGPREGREDLLDMLLGARDEETGEGMSDAQLRDEILTMMLAGHETTAMTLTWTLHLLASHPEVEAKLFAEIDGVLGGRPATMADLPALAYADRVVQESIRLYPPAWIIARRAEEEDDVGGLRVRPGDWVFLSPWVTHRRPDFWPEPDRFDPDRFAPERSAARHRYAWIPFSAGQRKCIGDQFALMEARLVLVTLLQHWRFRAVPGHVVEPEPLLTLRAKGGMPMIAERRQPAAGTGLRPQGAAAGRCPFHAT